MISVLTLVKNREPHLGNLVEGLRRAVPAPAELVIVDMSDNAIARPQCKFPVTVIRLDASGLPLAKARNLAALHASSDRLLFLDVDCIPASALCSMMSEALSKNDALICAEVLYLEADDVGEIWTEAELQVKATRHPSGISRTVVSDRRQMPAYSGRWRSVSGAPPFKGSAASTKNSRATERRIPISALPPAKLGWSFCFSAAQAPSISITDSPILHFSISVTS